jgi:hypothetical protein
MSLSISHPAAPGAYLQRDDQPPSVANLRTDVPGFVGIAERGPVGTPVPVESFRQFQAVFGGFIGGGFLAYAIRAFFENGGRRAHVVRAASDDPLAGAIPAACPIPVLGGGPGWTVAASTPGAWGDQLSVAFVERTLSQGLVQQSRSTSAFAVVPSTAGFAPNSLVRLRQPGTPTQVRVAAAVDAALNRVYWLDPDPDRRGLRQYPVTGFDPDRPLLIESLAYDLLVYSDGRLAAVSQGLSLVPESQAYAAVILGPIDFSTNSPPPGALPLVTLLPPPTASTDVPAPLDIASDVILPLAGGRDGLAALTVDDFIGDPMNEVYDSSGAPVLRGLAALAVIDEVAMLAVPDILIRPVAPPVFLPPLIVEDPCAVCPPPPAPALPAPRPPEELPPVFPDSAVLAVQAAMIDQCETLRDRVALLDPPWDAASSSAVGLAPIQAWRNNFDSAFGALYFSWIAAPDPLHLDSTGVRDIPPSGHIAGAIAATDLSIGVHKAPANIELAWAQDVTVPVDMAAHGVLNTQGVNVIRTAPGRALSLMGARTVASDPTFRFLNVRRLLCMIRKALSLATRWAVFEPNNPHTRAVVTASIDRFLRQLWTGGALPGATAAAAYQIVCDDTNNPVETQNLGELNVDVAVAPSTPFEFVLLRLGRSADDLDITERGVLAAGAG